MHFFLKNKDYTYLLDLLIDQDAAILRASNLGVDRYGGENVFQTACLTDNIPFAINLLNIVGIDRGF